MNSEKKVLKWVNPQQIYAPSYLNHRRLNLDYVATLEDSMHKDKFLPAFPLVVFEFEHIKGQFDGVTSLPYICACGMHRLTAAKNVGLVQVYADVRSGDMDEFIEVMHTDNFRFDPSLDSSLGQLFNKAEKAAACKSLLMIPKYAKLTNVALADLWHTSEGNIRRWRDEVQELLSEDAGVDEGSVQTQLCTPERRAELIKIHTADVRENLDGDKIRIRPRQEHSKETKGKWDYYLSIEAKVKAMKGLDWESEVKPYIEVVYKHSYASEMSFEQMVELDNLIEGEDPEFLEACRKYGEAKKALRAARVKYEQLLQDCIDIFSKYIGVRESQYDETWQKCFASFGNAVKKEFRKNLFGKKFTSGSVSAFHKEMTKLRKLKANLQSPQADWVADFKERYRKRRVNQRQKLYQELIEVHDAVLKEASEKYPTLDLSKLVAEVQDRTFYGGRGMLPPTPMKAEDIPDSLLDRELKNRIERYNDALKMVHDDENDYNWVRDLVPPETPDCDWDRVNQSLLILENELAKLAWGNIDPKDVSTKLCDVLPITLVPSIFEELGNREFGALESKDPSTDVDLPEGAAIEALEIGAQFRSLIVGWDVDGEAKNLLFEDDNPYHNNGVPLALLPESIVKMLLRVVIPLRAIVDIEKLAAAESDEETSDE